MLGGSGANSQVLVLSQGMNLGTLSAVGGGSGARLIDATSYVSTGIVGGMLFQDSVGVSSPSRFYLLGGTRGGSGGGIVPEPSTIVLISIGLLGTVVASARVPNARRSSGDTTPNC